MAEKPRQRGRPPKPAGQARRNNVTIRMNDALKASLQARADKEQRSLSEAIEQRLEQAELQDALEERGVKVFQEFRFLASLVEAVQAANGTNWRDDPDTCRTVIGLTQAFFTRFGPKEVRDNPPARGLRAMDLAHQYQGMLDGLITALKKPATKEN